MEREEVGNGVHIGRGVGNGIGDSRRVGIVDDDIATRARSDNNRNDYDNHKIETNREM